MRPDPSLTGMQTRRSRSRWRTAQAASVRCEHPRGSYENPLTRAQIEDKFRTYAKGVLPDAATEEIVGGQPAGRFRFGAPADGPAARVAAAAGGRARSMMGQIMRTLGLAFGALVALAGRARHRAAFPTKPITLVVPYAAGGNVDISTRILQAGIGDALGQPIVIENRPGAGGTIAGDYVARSTPDGHTLFVGSNGPIMLGPMTMPKPPYQWDKAFAPVSTLAVATNMLLVRPSLPVKTVAELVAYAKKNPGKLTLATSSGASINHFMGELLKLKTGITWTEVHYRGNAPAINDLMAGHVDVGLQQLTDSRAAHRGRPAARARGARAEARRRRCPTCRPSSRRACRTCRASPSTACSRRRTRRRPSSTSSAPRSARRCKRTPRSRSSARSAPRRAAARPHEFTAFLTEETAKWTDVMQKANIKVKE